jgi:hypothetical protein
VKQKRTVVTPSSQLNIFRLKVLTQLCQYFHQNDFVNLEVSVIRQHFTGVTLIGDEFPSYNFLAENYALSPFQAALYHIGSVVKQAALFFDVLKISLPLTYYQGGTRRVKHFY